MCLPKLVFGGRSRAVRLRLRPNGFVGESEGTENGVLGERYERGVENVDSGVGDKGEASRVPGSVWTRFEGESGGVEEHGVSYMSRGRLSIRLERE